MPNSPILIDHVPDEIWLIYDGGCPLCTYAAEHIALRTSVGHLHRLDARADPEHPLLHMVKDHGLDLDEGMALTYGGRLYHGKDALHLIGLLGSKADWFNKINAALFRFKIIAKLIYPPLRFLRNALLHVRGVSKIHNLQDTPLFKRVFAEDWDALPHIMKAHYAVRPGQGDSVCVEGHLNIDIAPWMKVINRITGMLISQSGRDIPVTVRFTSPEGSQGFHFERRFSFPDKTQYFQSHMRILNGNTLVEIMRFGLAWKLQYQWVHNKVILSHQGYALHIFGCFLPLPLGLFLGKGHAEEWAISDDEFAMKTTMHHPWLGPVFSYEGRFKITDLSCPIPS